MQRPEEYQDLKLPHDVEWRAVRAAAQSNKARAREALAEKDIELLDCWKRGERVCLLVRHNGVPKRLHFRIKDYPRRIKPYAKQRRSGSLTIGGSKLVWKELTVTQKARYVELQKHAESYPWQPTGSEMRGGSSVRNPRGFMEKSSRWWEAFFGIERDSWTCAKHPSIQRALDYLVRKAGGEANASSQSRRNVLTAVAEFCDRYKLSPEDACNLGKDDLSKLVQEFCDSWMHAGKIATAQNRLVSLSMFFDKNGFPRNSDRALALQSYGYHIGQAKLPTWSGTTEEYKPSRGEVWRMAHGCGSTLEGLRDKAIILFLLGTGARSGDIRALQYGRTYHFKVWSSALSSSSPSGMERAPS